MEIRSKVCDTDTNNISTLVNKFVTLWNEKNIKCFTDLFTDNAEFTDVLGQVAVGREEIKEQHKFPFEVTMKKAVLTLSRIYARALSEEMVIVTAKWEVTGNLSPKGEEMPNRNGVMQIIAKRIEGVYKISLVHNTDITQAYNSMHEMQTVR